MDRAYCIRELNDYDLHAMTVLLSSSSAINLSTFHADIAVSFLKGKNFGLFYDGSMVGCSSVIEMGDEAVLSFMYIDPVHRAKKVSLDFTRHTISAIHANRVLVRSKDISTFRRFVKKIYADVYVFDKQYFLKKIKGR